MPVEVVLLEAFANSVMAWMPGELFPCVDQAEADKRIARADAEKRRAMAVAREQEMVALTRENEATVVLAEAAIPAAVATAFRTGHLRGIRQQRKIAYAVSLR